MAGKLIVSFNGKAVGEYELDKDSFVIGRRPESDIHLDNLAVSGRHARILTIGPESFIEDLESTNGTLVNGDRITKQPLADGDEITIGKHVLAFRGDAASSGAGGGGGQSLAETIVISGEDGAALREAATEAERARQAAAEPEAAAGKAPAAGGSAANIGPARLRLVTESGDGKEMALSKALTTIGKPGVQVAAISRRQNGDFIVHVDGGENNAARPVINGSAIGAKSQLLDHEDLIEIAGVRMRYLKG
jgi:predicted component of type VI protein secretion system